MLRVTALPLVQARTGCSVDKHRQRCYHTVVFTMELLLNALYERVASHTLGADQHHPLDPAVLLHRCLGTDMETASERAYTYTNRDAY